MPVFIAPETPHGKELWTWDHYEDEVHPLSEPDKPIRGRRKRGFQEFPKAMYKAGRNDQNQIDLTSSRIAGNPDEQARYEREGYVEGPGKAVEKAEELEQDIAIAAANRAFHDRRMSLAAQEEAAAADAASADHLGEIPETPIQRRGPGRPRKDDSHG